MGRLRMRVFIALPLDEPLRRRVETLQQELASVGEGVKWVEPENLHLTLLFLGEIDAREVVDVCRAVREAVTDVEPFHLGVAGLGCFPNTRRPKTLWVGIEEGKEQVIALHRAIETPLLDLGAYRREERAFTPHITLGRVKTDQVTPGLRSRLTSGTDWAGGRMPVREVHVMNSELGPDGPTYTIVSRERMRG